MERILVMDAKNYDPNLEEIYRVAVRGIIFIDGKLLMTEDKYGEVKLPGGGIDPGEDDVQALVREVKEETGYDVKVDTIVPFGEIEEKRLSVHEQMIWHQFSRLYFCEVYSEPGACDYTENEKKYGFRQVLYTLEEAIEKNREMLGDEDERAWNCREYRTLLLLKEYMEVHEAFESYKAEAKEKWGTTDAYKEHAEKTKGYSKEKWNALVEEMNDIFGKFALCMKNGEDPDSVGAQSLVTELQTHITENYYQCTKEILAGLGQMYVLDERFKKNIDKHGDGTAEFVRDAIVVYCKKKIC